MFLFFPESFNMGNIEPFRETLQRYFKKSPCEFSIAFNPEERKTTIDIGSAEIRPYRTVAPQK